MARFKGIMLENVVQVSLTLSPDGQVASVIFGNLRVGVSDSKSEPSVATQAASITIQLTDPEADDNQKTLLVQQDIRGYVYTGRGSRAVLVAHLAGKTNLIAFSEPKEEEFTLSFNSDMPAGVDYQATLFLLVERCSDKGDSLLAVNSLDLVFAKPSNSGKNAGEESTNEEA